MHGFLHWVYPLSILFNYFLLIWSKNSVFTSVCQINLLRDEEQRLIKGLSRYIEATERNGEVVPGEVVSLLKKSETEQELLGDKFAESPLNSFHILHRIHRDWNEVFRLVWCNECERTPASQDFNITFGIVERKLGGWIREEDLRVSAINIVKLFELYDLEVGEVFDGNLQDDVSSAPLPAEELYYIASTADKQDRMRTALVWFEELYKRVSEDRYPQSSIHLITVARGLAGVYNKIGMPHKSIELLHQIKNEDLDNRQLRRDIEFYTLRLNGMPLEERAREVDPHQKNTPSRFTQLCRRSLKSTKEESKLKCFMTSSSLPLSFNKEEVYNSYPRISIFYDILSKEELRQLQNITSDRRLLYEQRTATSIAINNNKYSVRDIGHSLTLKLKNRMKSVLRISEQGETLESSAERRRVVTWNYVVTGAKSGGYKIFTRTRTRVPLLTGSVVVWYNEEGGGRGSQAGRTPGDCHTLTGSQTVVEDYLNEDGTVSTMKCFFQYKSI